MRKAIWVMLLLLGAIIPTTTWADNARDDNVNSGNAAHLGAVEDEANDEPEIPAERLNDGEEYTALGGIINTGWDACCHCGECSRCQHESCNTCGESSPCDTCRPRGGTFEFFGPIAVINQHPPNLIFLSPMPEVATVFAQGDGYITYKLDFANHMIREIDSGIIADYDFETERFAIDYREGRWGGELALRASIMSRNHGFLDGVISDWHQFFGMQNNAREERPSNMYRYVIASRDGLVFNDEGDVLGIGDLSVQYKHPIYDRNDGQEALSVRVGVKAPTGDADSALGSGNWDAQLGLLYQQQLSRRLRGYVNLDYIFVGEPEWDNVAWQDAPATLWGLEYAADDRTTYVAQYSTLRNALRIGSLEADKDTQDLTLGFNRRIGDNMVFTGGFMEDINPDTSVDFLVMAQIRIEF